MLETNHVVIAVGGKSVPQTGSTGDGYAWAEKAGHTITELFPTEVPILSNEPFIRDRSLQGLALRDINLSVLNPKGKAIISHKMDMLFTHFRPIWILFALRCSQFVVKALKKFKTNTIQMSIDALPEENSEQLFQRMLKQMKEDPKKELKRFKRLCP